MNISIIIHGKQSFLTEEKSDIYIQLPDLPDKRIYKVAFKVPKNIETPILYFYYDFKIDYKNLDKVWIKFDNNNLDFMFKNFHLATDFVLYKEDRTNKYIDKADSRWDDKNQVMYVDC